MIESDCKVPENPDQLFSVLRKSYLAGKFLATVIINKLLINNI